MCANLGESENMIVRPAPGPAPGPDARNAKAEYAYAYTRVVPYHQAPLELDRIG
jgi:hypothetical protein